MIHPSRTMPFDELLDGLQANVDAGLVNEVISEDGLSLFCYSKKCTYTKSWNKFTEIARGLILDRNTKTIVATPFPKFFNIGERESGWPDLPFEVFEKLDGSLIILFNWEGRWRCATKGSFQSEQAKWAQEQIDLIPHAMSFTNTSSTFLLESVYHANRIVVKYDYEELVLLGGYRQDGSEWLYGELLPIGPNQLPVTPRARRFNFNSISDLILRGKTLPLSEEGFVVRFANGLRLKVKGDEYCRVHRLVSRVTPLAIWESMKNGDDLLAIRKELPEEFWDDFDNIHQSLLTAVHFLYDSVWIAVGYLSSISDKEVGLWSSTGRLTEIQKRYAFPIRKNQHEYLHRMLYEDIRPKNNVLNGYNPSSLLDKISDDE